MSHQCETHLVDVVLYNSSPNHGSRTGEETGGDSFDWGKVDPHPAKPWIDEDITDRNEDYQGDGVEIINNIIRDTIGHHSSGLGCQIIDNLVISEPYSKL